jgi:hypothetical protein
MYQLQRKGQELNKMSNKLLMHGRSQFIESFEIEVLKIPHTI